MDIKKAGSSEPGWECRGIDYPIPLSTVPRVLGRLSGVCVLRGTGFFTPKHAGCRRSSSKQHIVCLGVSHVISKAAQQDEVALVPAFHLVQTASTLTKHKTLIYR